MDIKSDDQLLIREDNIESNSQYYDKKIDMLTEDLSPMIATMMDQKYVLKYSLEKKDSTKAQDNTTVAPDN